MKKIIIITTMALVFACTTVLLSYSGGVKEGNKGSHDATASPILATNGWTAAFADMAGVKDITLLTPYHVQHPPEYELKPTDIKKIAHATHIIYAGYESMMSKLKNNLNSDIMLIKINTGNNYKNIYSEVMKLAEVFGNQTIARDNLAQLEMFFDDWKKSLDSNPVIDKKSTIAVHFHYAKIVEEIGFANIIVFGPKSIEPALLREIIDATPQAIIDNIHGSVAKGILNDLPNTPYTLWRNFPTEQEKTLINTLKNNQLLLQKALKK